MMSSIGSSDIDYLMQNYRMLEERPIRRLEDQRSSIDKRLSLFNTLKTNLRSLQSLAKELSYNNATSIFSKRLATVSDDSFLTVTATSSASITSHSIEVNQLAKADKIVSSRFNISGNDLASSLGAGTYTFDVAVNGESQQVSVDVAAGDDNETILKNIVSGINNSADIGITASVIHDSEDTMRLVFTSGETGLDFQMGLSDSSGSLLNTIGMDDSVIMNGTSGGRVYDPGELNAVLFIDNVRIERNSNTVEDALEGVTLNLQNAHQAGDPPLTLNVENDTESIKTKLQEFIDSYNKVMDFIKTNTQVNSATHERSALSGDFAVSRLKMQVRGLLSQPVSGLAAGAPTILSSIGITADRGGKLSISDDDKLKEMLNTNLDQVADLFSSEDGVANRLVDILDSYTSGDGVISRRRDILQGQVTSLNNRIDRTQEMVDRRIEYYRQQFSQLQAASSMFSFQSSMISSMQQSAFFY
ncbi:MAG: flagellar filament capping protein FliD [Calditrichia bacterium]